MNKDRQIISELRNFFTESGCGMKKMLNMLQYNLLSYVKRFESYETIGGLFREITAQTVELLTNIITENKQLNAIMRVAQQLQTAA